MPCPNIWPRSASLDHVRKAVVDAEARETPVFSVHRTALANMDELSVQTLEKFWVRRGLFGSMGEASAFVDDFRRRFRKEKLKRRFREFPRRISAAYRKIRRRCRRVRRVGARQH